MEDYLVALRSRDNTPAALLRMDRDHERQLIDGYKEEIEMRIRGEGYLTRENLPFDEWLLPHAERERERQEEKLQRVHERKEAEKEEAEAATTSETTASEAREDLKIEVHATATHHLQEEPVVAHARSHSFSHGQAVNASSPPRICAHARAD